MKYFALLAISALLMVAAVAWSFYQRKNLSDESLARELGANLENEIAIVKEESGSLLNQPWSQLTHSFYLIENGVITRWSKTNPVIDIQECNGDFEWKLIQSSHSDLLLFKNQTSNSKFTIGVIPLRTGYDLVNQYLGTSWNKNIFPFDGIKILNPNGEGTAVISSGICLFKIQIERDFFISNYISVGLAAVSLLVICMCVFTWVKRLHQQKKYFLAFISLFSSLAIIRIAMVEFSFPSRWIYSRYFDPRYFASSSFNASVGDFLLNSFIVAVSCAYFFRIYSRLTFVKLSFLKDQRNRWLVSILFLTASYFSFLFPHLFIEAIFHDSTIPVDITSNFNFNGIWIVAVVALMFGCVGSFFFVHSFVRFSKLLVKGEQFIICLVFSAGLFTAYFLFSELNYWPTLLIGSCYFLILFSLKYYRALSQIGYRTFPFLLTVIIAYALQGAWGIWRFAEERKVRSMFRTASNLISNDVLGEYLLEQSNQKISNDLFLVASVESPLLSKNLARQKIKQVYLSDYFDRYAVAINLYHADGSPADAESAIDFATTIRSFQEDASKTGSDGIYLIRSANSKSLKKYLVVIPLKSKTSVRGYVVLDLSLKRIIPQQVYPELLSDNRFAQSLRNRDFSYAAFSDVKIIDQYGSFNFDRDFEPHELNDQKLYSTGVRLNNYLLVGASDDGDKRIVLAASMYQVFDIIANFSFLFVLGVVLIFMLLLFYFIRHLAKRDSLNYSARIQVFAYLSFILPLIAVSIMALRMINQSNEIQAEKEIENKGISLGESLSIELEKIGNNSSNFTAGIRERVTEITQATGLDVNLYGPKGDQIISSQPAIFKSRLIMPLPDRSSWERIANENYSSLKVRNKIGTLEYNSSFFAIKSANNGKLLGILELPFFNSATDGLKSRVLSNILVTFTVVFLLFSLFTANAIGKLTSPLRFIAKKLNATSLASNQPIEWNANDEIGRMVKEYNRMLANLEQSKTELARKEKESAWREIAKQVAHEIKNPLTPMKLTLQQMERSMMNGSLTKERTENSIQTLLAQVETLNAIAGSFSAFATMPTPIMTNVEVTGVIMKAVALFENHPLGNVNFKRSDSLQYVQGDEQLLGRIFSNIIINGLQSAKEMQVAVDITIEGDNEWTVINFKDNGSGIASELKDKIFLPHFSTKATGSGLGLAIAKQGIEQMGGTIWFETTGDGTLFSIRLKNS